MESFASRALSAIEAVIEKRASSSMLSLSIAGKAISQMTLTEQLDVRQRLMREVNQEKLSAKGLSPFKTIGIRL